MHSNLKKIGENNTLFFPSLLFFEHIIEHVQCFSITFFLIQLGKLLLQISINAHKFLAKWFWLFTFDAYSSRWTESLVKLPAKVFGCGCAKNVVGDFLASKTSWWVQKISFEFFSLTYQSLRSYNVLFVEQLSHWFCCSRKRRCSSGFPLWWYCCVDIIP